MGKYKELLLNTGLFAISSISSKLISFILVPLYTYYLSTSEYGVTDMSVIVISLITPLCTGSITDAVLRFAIDDRKQSAKYISIGLQVTIFSILIVGLLLPLLDLPFLGGLGQYKLLFLLNYIISILQLFLSNVARINNQLKLIPISSVISSLSNMFFAYIFIVLENLRVNGYFYSMILSGVLGIIAFIWNKNMHIPIILDKSNIQLLKRMFVFALPLVPNAVFWWIGTSVNRFLITSMIGIASSGLFAAASKIPNLITMVYQIFQQAWNLSVFQEFRHSGLARFYENIFKIILSILSVSASVLIVSSKPIAELFLQKNFYSSWTLMPLLIVAVYFNSLNSFLGTISTACMKTKNLLVTTFFGALLNICFTWILIPICGLYGACIGMVISNFAILVLRFIISLRLLKFHIPWVSMAMLFAGLSLQAILKIYSGFPSLLIQICLIFVIWVISISMIAPLANYLNFNRRKG